MSKYPWHPGTRPPPADPSLAANIALIGRVGKCLEAALDEIQREDDALHTTAADEGDGISVGHSFEDEKLAALNDTLSIEEQSAGKKRKRADSCDSCSLDQSKTHDADITNHNDSTTPDNSIRMDKLISKSIMEAYGKAVAASNFDAAAGEIIPSVATNSKDNNHAITAPAAMLCGEIDHYNRIGDRWRIVLKNASIKPRKTTIITNGMTGHSLRRRLVMDWDDEGNSGQKSWQLDGGGKKKRGARQCDDDDVEAYHFKGTVQIMAYDDDI
mmetsp:Transcript_8018/g.11992  ORF Transcript_8018/g.11992 Transcript_8018/m.11992 type:complete len:271 (+) Transcript_8018:55-867(+)